MTQMIHTDISDLFFNTYHAFGIPGRDKYKGEYLNLQEEAQYFIDSLQRLGVSTPTVDDLIADFMKRV